MEETPTIAEILGTLDELAAAARAGDRHRYQAALRLADRQQVTEEQKQDAYRWGRRDSNGPAPFDWMGGE